MYTGSLIRPYKASITTPTHQGSASNIKDVCLFAIQVPSSILELMIAHGAFRYTNQKMTEPELIDPQYPF
jgi:hypothetical protein